MPRLTKMQARALEIVRRMLAETGKRCFTYNTLMRYWREHPDIPINANTLERRIRELVELGILRRVEIGRRRGKPRYAYCLEEDGHGSPRG